MDIRIHEWLNKGEYGRWVCSDIQALIDALAKHGNTVHAVGFANYKDPETVVLLSQPLNEVVAKLVANSRSKLQLHYNGIGKLHSVVCSKHYVLARCGDGEV